MRGLELVNFFKRIQIYKKKKFFFRGGGGCRGGGGATEGGGGVGARISEFVLLRNQIKNIFFFQCGGEGGGLE